MIDKLKEISKRLSLDTKSLVEAESINSDGFLVVLLGIYRASAAALRDINYLLDFEETGASVLDLSRKISECFITVEYMIMKGKEKMSKTFQDYIFVQIQQDIDFYRSIGQNPEEVNQEIRVGAEVSEQKFNDLPAEMHKRKTWAGRSSDGMLQDLYNSGTLGDFDYSRILQSYVEGSRCNHPNPIMVKYYLDTEFIKASNEYYLKQAILMAIILYLRLTTRYLDEVRLITKDNELYKDVENSVLYIYKQIKTL